MLAIWIFWWWINISLSKLIVNIDNSTREYESFNAMQVNPPFDTGKSQWVMRPKFTTSCQLEWNTLPNYDSKFNNSQSVLVVVPTKECQDYVKPTENFFLDFPNLLERGFPPLATVLWCDVVGSREVLGSPYSSIYNEQGSFVPKRNITYQIVKDSKFAIDIVKTTGPVFIEIVNENSRWQIYLTSILTFSWLISFRVIKFIVLLAEFILLGFIIARSKGKAFLQIGMLTVVVLHLGGEMILSLAMAGANVTRLYLTTVLIGENIINSCSIFSWCNVVWRLRTCVNIKKFKQSAVLECIGISIALILQLLLIVFASEWIGNEELWYDLLLWLTLFLIAVIPATMIIWFFIHALKFCPIFHATAKLVNAQWLTMFLLLTRISFIVNLISTYLLFLHSTNPAKFTVFKIINNIAAIVYNVMILLTVMKIQTISQIQHNWTADKLGITLLPDGTVISQPDAPRTRPLTPLSQNKPSEFSNGLGTSLLGEETLRHHKSEMSLKNQRNDGSNSENPGTNTLSSRIDLVFSTETLDIFQDALDSPTEIKNHPYPSMVLGPLPSPPHQSNHEITSNNQSPIIIKRSNSNPTLKSTPSNPLYAQSSKKHRSTTFTDKP